MNAFLKRWLPWTVLPIVGGTAITLGSTWWLRMPRQEQCDRLDIETATLLDEARGLTNAAITPATTHSDELPIRRGLGDLASELAERATATGVRIATIEVALDQGTPVTTATAVTTQPVPTASAAMPATPAQPGQLADPSLAVVTPNHLDLLVLVEGSFDAVVRFLHSVETNPRLTRVVDLQLKPQAQLVEATLTVRGFHFAGTALGSAATTATTMPATPGGR